MPSPFPGFDPYLETPDIWPDFHDALASEIRGELNRSLPTPYYARLEMRQEIGIVGDERRARNVVPDVSIAATRRQPVRGGDVAVLDGPRTEASAGIEVTVENEKIRHPFVEIRDSSRGHKLITLLEIVSPSNKQPGADRRAYQHKQREVLDSDASLIEIDLLRTGARPLGNMNLEEIVDSLNPQPDYLVTVNRAWRRIGNLEAYELFPIALHEPLPCIPVPLAERTDESTLDLQWCFNLAYDRGPYQRGAVDYGQPPAPPLAEQDQAWARQMLAGKRSQPG